MDIVYLDNASTSRVSEKSKMIIDEALEEYANPSSNSEWGSKVRDKVEDARRRIAEAIGAEPNEIVYTSGGAEGNAMTIKGIANRRTHLSRWHAVTTTIEHPTVLRTFRELERRGLDVTYLSVGTDMVRLTERLRKAIKRNTILVSMMAVNNETGMRLPVFEIGNICNEYGVPLHMDWVQGFETEAVRLDDEAYKMSAMTVSGHKFGTPAGIGFEYIRSGTLMNPLIQGTQERGMRGGTENVPYILALAEAVEDVCRFRSERLMYYWSLYEKLMNEMASKYNGNYEVNHEVGFETPRIVSLTLDGIDAETLMKYLESKGIYVSAGSACQAHEQKPSYVLKDFGLTDNEARQTIRVSFSYLSNTANDIVRLVDALETYRATFGV